MAGQTPIFRAPKSSAYANSSVQNELVVLTRDTKEAVRQRLRIGHVRCPTLRIIQRPLDQTPRALNASNLFRQLRRLFRVHRRLKCLYFGTIHLEMLPKRLKPGAPRYRFEDGFVFTLRIWSIYPPLMCYPLHPRVVEPHATLRQQLALTLSPRNVKLLLVSEIQPLFFGFPTNFGTVYRPDQGERRTTESTNYADDTTPNCSRHVGILADYGHPRAMTHRRATRMVGPAEALPSLGGIQKPGRTPATPTLRQQGVEPYLKQRRKT